MYPLKRAEFAPVPPERIEAMAQSLGLPVDAVREIMARERAESQIWLNDLYTVITTRRGEVLHISIRRNDRKHLIDWRHKQAIKNQLAGPECEAVELFPAESRLVDTANQFHLWAVLTPGFRFPLGFDGPRTVVDGAGYDPDTNTAQRPLTGEKA